MVRAAWSGEFLIIGGGHGAAIGVIILVAYSILSHTPTFHGQLYLLSEKAMWHCTLKLPCGRLIYAMNGLTCKLSDCCIFDTDNLRYILSIDVGIHNLGISVIEADANYMFRQIIWVDLINITEFKCNKQADCPHHHDRTIADWMHHVFDQNSEFFERCDHILIERQPPGGIVAVEQLIFARYRHKAILIAPNSVHKYFNMGWADYPGRKRISETIATRHLKGGPVELLEQYQHYDRRHDISDSILFGIYWCNKQNTKIHQVRVQREREEKFRELKIRVDSGEVNVKDMMERFRYNPHGAV